MFSTLTNSLRHEKIRDMLKLFEKTKIKKLKRGFDNNPLFLDEYIIILKLIPFDFVLV
mgnify:CR=1 FL=1